MSKLLDKLIIFLFCLIFYLQSSSDNYVIVPVIIAITCSAFNSYFERDFFRLICVVIYIAASVHYSGLLFFIPVIGHDILLQKWWPVLFLSLIPLVLNQSQISSVTIVLIALLTALSGFMKYRADTSEKIHQEYIELRDNAQEISQHMEGKNKELMERQDYEINLATLQERNRIAREIHDSVGHLLSSSILQIGALMAECQEDVLKKKLDLLNTTLLQGMNSIRESIHDLHNESLDLYIETRTLLNNFYFCPVSFDYDLESNPDRKIKYAFISIIKEALSNIMKHSDASHVYITLREHPALYQLIVKDNGTKKAMNLECGIGLKNIADRVNSLNGNINISNDNGFVVFISVPKEWAYESRNRG